MGVIASCLQNVFPEPWRLDDHSMVPKDRRHIQISYGSNSSILANGPAGLDSMVLGLRDGGTSKCVSRLASLGLNVVRSILYGDISTCDVLRYGYLPVK